MATRHSFGGGYAVIQINRHCHGNYFQEVNNASLLVAVFPLLGFTEGDLRDEQY